MSKPIITRNPQKPLFTRSANEFLIKSQLNGPIESLSLLQRGLWFAELSMYSYLAEDQFSLLTRQAGFTVTDSFSSHSHDGHAYLVESDADTVVVFRGAGERDWDSIKQDEQKASIFAETIGKVQRCFKTDADELWPQIETALEPNRKPTWFCGHSLGGAYANICAQRCVLSYIRTEPAELHTFGSPRLGNKKYVENIELKHFRWVNNNDRLPRLPSARLGYRHNGQEMYLDRQGQLRAITGFERATDRVLGYFGSFLKGKMDHVEDHSVIQYVDRIFALVRAETPICSQKDS